MVVYMLGDTPFNKVTPVDDVGRDGGGDRAAEILRVTYNIYTKEIDPVMTSSEMASFLQALQTHISALTGALTPELDSGITFQQYKGILNTTREQTVPSPSCIHYGHFKSS